jgi:hypothetical protein
LLIWEGNLDALYGRVLDAAIGLMSADMGSIQTFYPEEGELRLLAWREDFIPNQLPFENELISIPPAPVARHCQKDAGS